MQRSRRTHDKATWKFFTFIAILFIFSVSVMYIYSVRLDDSTVRLNVKNCDTQVSSGIVVHSWAPRVFSYKNFITSEEARYLIEKGKPFLQRSKVVGDNKDEVSTARTSMGTFIGTDGDPIIMGIEQKIAEWAMIPVEHGESFYLLRYQVGEQYTPHYDYFVGDGIDRHIGMAGQRKATVIIYLSIPEEGGATSFPTAGVNIVPEIGDAVLFYSLHPNGTFDTNSLHSGGVVTKGEKWIITKWMRERPYEYSWYAEQQRLWSAAKANPQAKNPFV